MRAQVNVMQKHADMLGTVLEQAKEGWLSKNDPEFVAGRKRMLQSYLRAALRFADHHAVEEQVRSAVRAISGAFNLLTPSLHLGTPGGGMQQIDSVGKIATLHPCTNSGAPCRPATPTATC